MATIKGWWWGEDINGTASSDTIYGYGGDDRIFGDAGNDHLYGGDGNDTIIAGLGNDHVYGQDGQDSLNGNGGHDTLYGGDNNDTLRGHSGNDYLYGGSDHDTLYGGDDNDLLYGGSGADTLWGDEGSDFLDGGSGNDEIYGGNGSDVIVVSSGGDEIDGGSGFDYMDYSNVEAIYGDGAHFRMAVISGSNALNVLIEDASGDVVDWQELRNVEEVIATPNADSMVGDHRDNVFFGIDGSDTLEGGDGNDTLDGGSGNDQINGGRGFDTMTGDVGLDDFGWESANELQLGTFGGQIDRITDFAAGDEIELTAVDANTRVTGNNAFVMVNSYTGAGGELIVERMTSSAAGDTWLVRGDLDGDRSSDFNFEVTTTHDLALNSIQFWDL